MPPRHIPDTSVIPAIAGFIEAHFDKSEFARFLSGRYRDVHAVLDSNDNHAEIVHAAVLALSRRYELDTEFFADLAEQREKLIPEIELLAARAHVGKVRFKLGLLRRGLQLHLLVVPLIVLIAISVAGFLITDLRRSERALREEVDAQRDTIRATEKAMDEANCKTRLEVEATKFAREAAKQMAWVAVLEQQVADCKSRNAECLDVEQELQQAREELAWYEGQRQALQNHECDSAPASPMISAAPQRSRPIPSDQAIARRVQAACGWRDMPRLARPGGSGEDGEDIQGDGGSLHPRILRRLQTRVQRRIEQECSQFLNKERSVPVTIKIEDAHPVLASEASVEFATCIHKALADFTMTKQEGAVDKPMPLELRDRG